MFATNEGTGWNMWIILDNVKMHGKKKPYQQSELILREQLFAISFQFDYMVKDIEHVTFTGTNSHINRPICRIDSQIGELILKSIRSRNSFWQIWNVYTGLGIMTRKSINIFSHLSGFGHARILLFVVTISLIHNMLVNRVRL